ncbi:peptide/nickel transport system permease protein [Aquamicrobium aerolatum DSM 21857]|uniref:Peptide/nickel transport system permease protein n=2 Tax=Aerobium TaxID=3143707 RepID=A0A1I3I2Q5_9HYPH|nr:peptide/nickel transport system permease protein [Aquamicrobium aerolatum DSM 21857]
MMKFIRQNPLFVIGFVMVVILLGVAGIYDWVSPYGLEQMDMRNRFALPSAIHWLGTDNFGRDLATRLAAGARISLTIGIGTVAISALIGTALGIISGYYGGYVDTILMRVVDVFMAFPAFVLALAIIAVLGPGPLNLVISLAAIYWTQYARVARAMTLTEREKDYVAAARGIGASATRIITLHILPNILGPLIVLATFGMGTAIVAESGMSFLGLGVQPPTPTWGWSLAYGLKYLRAEPWMSTAAGLSLMFAVLAFNLLGDGIRDYLDPNRVTTKAVKKAVRTNVKRA